MVEFVLFLNETVFQLVRNLCAILLLICFGVVSPAAAVPLRVCLLEASQRTDDCCKKCQKETKDCCADLDRVPDSPLPGAALDLPPFVAFELPTFEAAARLVNLVPSAEFRLLPPIRGPDTPSAYRAVLSIWRI